MVIVNNAKLIKYFMKILITLFSRHFQIRPFGIFYVSQYISLASKSFFILIDLKRYGKMASGSENPIIIKPLKSAKNLQQYKMAGELAHSVKHSIPLPKCYGL